MDDPLVGVTIWQSVQLTKKAQVRQGFLKELGVDDVVLKAAASCSTSRQLEKGDSSKQQETAVGRKDSTYTTTLPVLNDMEKARMQDCNEHHGDEDEEEELTETSMLQCHGGRDHSGGRKTPPNTTSHVDHTQILSSPVPQPQNFWLMRLFESKLFDMSIAIGYIFNSKEADVQAYLGNKLFVSHEANIVYT